MNAFILDNDPAKAAEYHDDKRCVKMCLESNQVLCSVFHMQAIEAPYRLTHQNHPTCLFARKSCLNFEWMLQHSKALCAEYSKRFNRRHKSQDVVEWCDKNADKLVFDDFDQTEFALAISDDKKCRRVAGFDNMTRVQQYRLYFAIDKNCRWAKRSAPNWWLELREKHKNLVDAAI